MNHTAKNILIGTAGAAGLFLASAATANADTAHKVAKNDTVWDLSQKYGVSVESIETLNKIDQNSHLIVTGQTLQIPAKNDARQQEDKTTEATHEVSVKDGDSLWSIAQAENTTVDKLRSLNGLAADENLIYPGQTLKVSGAAQAAAQTQTASADTQQASAQTQQSAQQTTSADQTQQRMLRLNKKLRLLLTLKLLKSNKFKLSFLQTIRLIRSFPENLFGRSHKLTV